jgi:hypothetical protein
MRSIIFSVILRFSLVDVNSCERFTQVVPQTLTTIEMMGHYLNRKSTKEKKKDME